jgi:capsular polysaccharide biosynthesis protein
MDQPVEWQEGYISCREKPRNLLETDLHLFKDAFAIEIKKRAVWRLSNARVLKYAVFSLRRLKCFTAFTHILPFRRIARLKLLYRLLTPAQTLDKGIWITDEWSAEYYHWLNDALPRLISVTHLADESFRVVLPAFYEDRPYIPQTLSLLGIRPYYYNPGKQLKVSTLLLPAHTSPLGNSNPDLINRLRSLLAVQSGAAPHRKIYISRQKAKVRKVVNEAAVIACLEQYGYEVHFLEDYTIAQQIALLSQAVAITGLHGAGLTDMLFMPPGGQVLELRNEEDRNNCYFALSSDLGHAYYYLTSKGNTANMHNVEIEVDLAKLQEAAGRMEQERTERQAKI